MLGLGHKDWDPRTRTFELGVELVVQLDWDTGTLTHGFEHWDRDWDTGTAINGLEGCDWDTGTGTHGLGHSDRHTATGSLGMGP